MKMYVICFDIKNVFNDIIQVELSNIKYAVKWEIGWIRLEINYGIKTEWCIIYQRTSLFNVICDVLYSEI